MYITTQKSNGKRLQKPSRVNSAGLGASEYSGQSKTGEMLNTAAKFYNPLTSMLPIKSLPIIGQLDPLTLSLAMATGGLSLMPGISKIIGGLFKKATHMESCMKWWSDSNIRSMVNVSPYPVDVIQSFPDESREYQLQHASSVTGDSSIQSLISGSGRIYNIGTYYVSQVRANPDMMQASCASMPQGQAETHANINPADVNAAFDQMKEQARQQEYQDTITSIGRILSQYKRVIERKVAVVQQTRDTATIFKMPVGVTSITKGGALVLDPSKNTNLVIDRGVIGPSIIRKK